MKNIIYNWQYYQWCDGTMVSTCIYFMYESSNVPQKRERSRQSLDHIDKIIIPQEIIKSMTENKVTECAG